MATATTIPVIRTTLELPHQLLPPICTRRTYDLFSSAAAVIDPPSASAPPPPTSPFPVFLRVTKRRLQSLTDPTVSLHIDLTDSPSFGPSPLGDTLRQARRKACRIRTHTATPSTSSMPPHDAMSTSCSSECLSNPPLVDTCLTTFNKHLADS